MSEIIDYYDVDGSPLTREESNAAWRKKANAFDSEKPDGAYWIGGDTVVAHEREHYVSTVWLGLNHQHGNGPPLIFETMIFCHHGGEDCPLDDATWRYSTLEEATKGHARAVEVASSCDKGDTPEDSARG